MKKGKKRKGRKGTLSKSEIDIEPAPDSILNNLKYEKELEMDDDDLFNSIDGFEFDNTNFSNTKILTF